ncbi:LPXTG cell wall anchor domain-containing protein, partial [Bacillus cereus group sp. BfR-BA-01381]|uniref:LPXTG cell wall anchor domain-containing protein n=1 Tax=Bacillus cereus group sp. BfR-BA-01381 TaxID=2920325 RepID=UPI001F566C87
DHYETGILYSGIVMQNIVEKLIPKEEEKEPTKEVEEVKEEEKEPTKEVEEVKKVEEVKEEEKEVEEEKEEVKEPTKEVEGSKAEVKETGKEIEGSKDAVNQSTVVQEQNVNNQVVKENKPVVNKQEESKKSLGATGGQANTSMLLSGVAFVLSALSMIVFRKRLFKK